MGNLHGVDTASLRSGTKCCGISEHLGQRYLSTDNLRTKACIHTFNTSAAGVQVAHNVAHILFWNGNFHFHDWLKQNRLTLVFGRFERHRTGNLKRHFVGIDIMVGTIDNSSFDVYQRESCKNSVLHGFFDTGLDWRDIFSWNRSTHNFCFRK